MYEIMGLLILFGFGLTIAYFMLTLWRVTVADAREEEKRIFDQRVEHEVARRLEYERQNTRYRVYYKPVELVNETDIDWGECKRHITIDGEAV